MPTYSEMLIQIEELQKQASRQRKEEYGDVLKTIKRQIAEYGITAEELGFAATAPKTRGRKPGAKAATGEKKPRGRKPGTKPAGNRAKVAPKYRDPAGNTWTGRGKQPRWLAEALAQGQSLESFLIPAA